MFAEGFMQARNSRHRAQKRPLNARLPNKIYNKSRFGFKYLILKHSIPLIFHHIFNNSLFIMLNLRSFIPMYDHVTVEVLFGVNI